jgi:hypothetical protein
MGWQVPYVQSLEYARSVYRSTRNGRGAEASDFTFEGR